MMNAALKAMAEDIPLGITYVGCKVSALTKAASGDTTIDLTTGLTGGSRSAVANGDLILVMVHLANTDGVGTTVKDGSAVDYSTMQANVSIIGTGSSLTMCRYKFCSGDSSVVVGPTGSSGNVGQAFVFVFDGVDQTTPSDVTPTTFSSSAGDVNPASITPSTAGAYIVIGGGGSHLQASGETLTSSDLTDFRYLNDSTIVEDGIGGAGHKAWTSGAFDAATWTFSTGSTNASTAITVAIRPAT